MSLKVVQNFRFVGRKIDFWYPQNGIFNPWKEKDGEEKSSEGIITHQGHINQVSANVHSVIEWPTSLLEASQDALEF